MNKNIKKLLEELIKEDNIKPVLFEAKYTHSKNINNVGGSIVDWINISSIIHTWYSLEEVNRIDDYNGPLLKVDGDIIRYTPSVISDYIEKMK